MQAGRLGDWATFAGGPAVHGEDVWQYRAAHPDEGARFDAAMVALSRRVGAAVLEAYDFGGCATVADVGGGHGALLAAVPQRS